jgi:hypothetical protein
MLAKKVSGLGEGGRPGRHEIKKASRRGSRFGSILLVRGNFGGFLSN